MASSHARTATTCGAGINMKFIASYNLYTFQHLYLGLGQVKSFIRFFCTEFLQTHLIKEQKAPPKNDNSNNPFSFLFIHILEWLGWWCDDEKIQKMYIFFCHSFSQFLLLHSSLFTPNMNSKTKILSSTWSWEWGLLNSLVQLCYGLQREYQLDRGKTSMSVAALGKGFTQNRPLEIKG